jgi:hypothetical protein
MALLLGFHSSWRLNATPIMTSLHQVKNDWPHNIDANDANAKVPKLPKNTPLELHLTSLLFTEWLYIMAGVSFGEMNSASIRSTEMCNIVHKHNLRKENAPKSKSKSKSKTKK